MLKITRPDLFEDLLLFVELEAVIITDLRLLFTSGYSCEMCGDISYSYLKLKTRLYKSHELVLIEVLL